MVTQILRRYRVDSSADACDEFGQKKALASTLNKMCTRVCLSTKDLQHKLIPYTSREQVLDYRTDPP